MKHLVLLAVSSMTLSSVALADEASDLEKVRAAIGLRDERLIPYSCNTTEGTSGFQTPKASTVYYCLAKFNPEDHDMALVYLDRKGAKAAFRVSDCKTVGSAGDQEGGMMVDKCSIKKMDLATLEASGRAGVITFTTRWMYSEGGTTFEFKKDGKKYFGAPVSLSELLHGYP